jgi:thioredoxin-like negative regulator of GroEL
VLVDDWGPLVEEYAIRVVPTVLFFRDGRLLSRLDGELGRGLDAQRLRGFLDRCALGRP